MYLNLFLTIILKFAQPLHIYLPKSYRNDIFPNQLLRLSLQHNVSITNSSADFFNYPPCLLTTNLFAFFEAPFPKYFNGNLSLILFKQVWIVDDDFSTTSLLAKSMKTITKIIPSTSNCIKTYNVKSKIQSQTRLYLEK